MVQKVESMIRLLITADLNSWIDRPTGQIRESTVMVSHGEKHTLSTVDCHYTYVEAEQPIAVSVCVPKYVLRSHLKLSPMNAHNFRVEVRQSRQHCV